MKRHLQFLSLLLLTVSSGCVMPVPSVSHKQGTALSAKDLAFIKVGETTRSQTIEQLGTRYREANGKSALAYSWETGGLSVDWSDMIYFREILGTTESKSWRAVFIEFGDNATVKRVARVNLSSKKSLDQQLEDWLARSRRKSPPATSRQPKLSINTPSQLQPPSP